ncbi:MAG TPA: V-type ATPase 116kDa subunit family protein [Pseudonocardiaceae bacterium]|nr:V-type ATPase 116kDa subunit family protein [Pseudonocardiaceae bacterium]
MRWRDLVTPVPMSRIALVAPEAALRDTLVRVADAGVVEIDRTTAAADTVIGEAAARLQRLHEPAPAVPVLWPREPDLDELQRAGRLDVLAGEAELQSRRDDSIVRGGVAGLVGWMPAAELPALAGRLSEVGGAVVPLARPRGVEPPTALRRAGPGRTFGPLVLTYATVPYRDIDPTLLAGLAYVVMFGVMFGDAGHGALLLLGALLLRAGRPRWLDRPKLRSRWLFIAGAGLASMIAGIGYGEFFGPTGVVPVAWLSPLEEPVRLLVAGISLGAVLLGIAYALGTVNRVREGGWSFALYAPTGVAGSLLFLAGGVTISGVYFGLAWLTALGVTAAVAALVLAFIGLLTGSGGGFAGAAQATVELFDLVVRLGSNVASFARLAAFGLTHAALGWVVWQGTQALWGLGGAAMAGAVLLFAAGNAVAFVLEALVAGVQALRLEYYELFSRIFLQEGRPFQPWRVPTANEEEL